MSKNKKMKFREFLEVQASLMPAVNFAPGSSAFYDLLRAWNTMAILQPERCADVVVWEKGGMPTTMSNDLDIKDIQKTLKTKPMENLPDNLRTGYNPQEMIEKKKREQEKKRKEQEELDKKQAEIDAAKQPEDEDVTQPVEDELPKDEDGVIVPTHAQEKDKQDDKQDDKKKVNVPVQNVNVDQRIDL